MTVQPGKPPQQADMAWLELMREARKESLKAIEDTAKQLIGLNGIISGIYFGALSFSKIPANYRQGEQAYLLLAPLVLWLFSLVAAVWSLAPKAYTYNPYSPNEARDAYLQLVTTKDRRLMVALALFVLSIVALLAAVWFYLPVLLSGN